MKIWLYAICFLVGTFLMVDSVARMDEINGIDWVSGIECVVGFIMLLWAGLSDDLTGEEHGCHN